MAKAMKVAFKELTASDFYWINQPGLAHGGGQSYIDFDTSDISPNEWKKFFESAASQGSGASGPFWTFSVRNLGPDTVQSNVKLGQRRSTSFSIRSQKLPEHSSGGRRLHAWSPHHTTFPSLPSSVTGAEQVPFALIAELRIFLILDDAGEFWAGWTRMLPPGVTDSRFKQMFDRKSGLINLAGDYEIDPTKPQWPFARPADKVLLDPAGSTSDAPEKPTSPPVDTFKSPVADFKDEIQEPGAPDDDNLWDPTDVLDAPDKGILYSVQQIRQRNQAAARSVRKLYTECQITGNLFVFQTTKGKPYLEVHHLIPLGRGGADAPYNMIVVSAQAHKMLHHADVSPIDLSKIVNNELSLTINGQPAKITWHPMHAALVASKNRL